MGNADNITEITLSIIAEQESKDLQSFKKDLLNELNQNQVDPKMEVEFTKAAKAWSQSVEEAKRNAKELLKSEVK